MHDRERIKERFLKPENSVRAFPFWAWNGRLDCEEIRRQAEEMKEQGMGGFFMHSREGLETEYMGIEWMQCIQTGVAAAKELGMYAWLYDEDRWPSGTAGGLVTAESEEYRCKGLTMEVCGEYCEAVRKEKGLLAIYAAKVEGDDIFSLRLLWKAAAEHNEPSFGEAPLHRDEGNLDRLCSWKSSPASACERLCDEGYPDRLYPDEASFVSTCERLCNEGNLDGLRPGEVCLVVRLEASGSSEWFNGGTPPDNMNPKCVERFLALTHEKYYKLCGEEFGKTIPGIFTDEPSLADTHASFPANRSWIPWTYGFREYFMGNRGYDPLEDIPYFYFSGEKTRKIRHDYWYMITLRFSEVYAGTVSKWCESHGLSMTGHFLQEDKLGLVVRVGGAVMPLYEYEHIPGIDMLQERTEEFLTVKQCSSVAHQMGRSQVLSETYGCTGWEFPFEGQRRIGDWQYVLGVNRRCQHLAHYSLAGCRKRDYPPDFHYNTSWWSHAHVVEDYFARLSVMLEEGTPLQRLLLLHPVSTAWSMLGASPYGNPVRRNERDVPAVNEYGYRFNSLIKTLCFQHFDMDLGDEILLAKHGRVRGEELQVGEACYQVWVIPPIDTLLRSTFALLKAFCAAGGRLIVMMPCAFMLEGEGSPLLMDFWQSSGCHLVESEGALLQELEEMAVRTVSVKDCCGNEDIHCLVQQRKTGEDETLFLVNCDERESREVTVELACQGVVEEWNALTGEMYPIETESGSGRLIFRTVLGAADSKLYRILRGESSELQSGVVLQNGLKLQSGVVLQNGLKLQSKLVPQNVPELQSSLEPQNVLVPQSEPVPKKESQFQNRTGWATGTIPRECSVYVGLCLPEGAEVACRFPERTSFSCTIDNTLTLDRCRYQLEGEAWSEDMLIWQAEREVRERLGMRPIHYNGQEQRYRWVKQPHPSDGARLELLLCFWAEEVPEAAVSLAIEHPENFEIFLNGKAQGQKIVGWLLDKDIQKVALDSLQKGKNWILLRCRYQNVAELEECYLCGTFGVAENRHITAMPRRLSVGDWTKQGFFHYAGSICYQYQFYWDMRRTKRVYLRLGDYSAVCLQVSINGRKIDVPWKAASLLNLTGLLRRGKNQLTIETAGSPRNLFGPFHLRDGKRGVTNDRCFHAEGADYVEMYNVVPYGLYSAPLLYEL